MLRKAIAQVSELIDLMASLALYKSELSYHALF